MAGPAVVIAAVAHLIIFLIIEYEHRQITIIYNHYASDHAFSLDNGLALLRVGPGRQHFLPNHEQRRKY